MLVQVLVWLHTNCGHCLGCLCLEGVDSAPCSYSICGHLPSKLLGFPRTSSSSPRQGFSSSLTSALVPSCYLQALRFGGFTHWIQLHRLASQHTMKPNILGLKKIQCPARRLQAHQRVTRSFQLTFQLTIYVFLLSQPGLEFVHKPMILRLSLRWMLGTLEPLRLSAHATTT